MRKPARRVLAVAALICSLLIPGAAFVGAPAYAAPQPGAPSAERRVPPPPSAPLSTEPRRVSAKRAPAFRAIPGTLVPTPPMGFNNWNAFGCDVSETLIKETADIIVDRGLKDVGYEYVNIDDCWSKRERENGLLVPDPVKFPSGIKGVADYVHSKGLKLGIYGDAGTKTCAGYPGSLGHELTDAKTWAQWGVDYLKYDNCNNQSDGSVEDFVRRYTAMRKAIDATGRDMVYSICEWGQSRPWEWATGVGDLWRTTGDISDNWASLRTIIAANAPLAPFAGPGHWNDPDMLQIGNGGMTDTEYRTHMSMWAMMAAPLIMGNDLREATAQTLAILGNKDIIAIDQDPLGVQGAVVSNANGLMVLDKPLANGERAIALYNSTDNLATISVAAADTGLEREKAYRLQDVWTGSVHQVRSTISAAVPAHGTVVYRVRREVEPTEVPPVVTVGATAGTLVPGTTAGSTLTTTVTNRGYHGLRHVAVSAQAPAGWTVTASSPATRSTLKTDASFETTWNVVVPPGTVAGRYPVRVTANYKWGRERTPATSSSELVTVVVTAPAAGRRHLSLLTQVSAANAVGPVEIDQSNGGTSQGDGALITIGGQVFTRGLGTTAPSEILYYVGGQCSQLVTSVGIDDEARTTLPATFTIYADDRVAAASGPVAYGDAPRQLTADLTGAAWLRLVTTGSGPAPDGTTINDHTAWAAPVLTCGDTDPSDPVLPEEQTLFSFEGGTDGFGPANADPGGSVAQSTDFHTHGEHGLQVTVPTAGNWFGRLLPEAVDLTGKTRLKFDVKGGPTVGTSGEIAIQVGEAQTWCQGGLWAWTNANTSRTITEEFQHIHCPAGVTLDVSQIRGVWVFLNGTGAQVDNIRAE